MTSLLHIDASASAYRDSVSRQLSALFAQTWRAEHGDAGHRYRDVANDPVPPVTGAYVNLGRRVERHGVSPLRGIAAVIESEAEQREWEIILPLITEFQQNCVGGHQRRVPIRACGTRPPADDCGIGRSARSTRREWASVTSCRRGSSYR